jgi:hypothetical protein
MSLQETVLSSPKGLVTTGAFAVREGSTIDTTALEYANENVVKKMMKDSGLERENAEQLFSDMLRFLCLSGAKTGHTLTPPHRIDLAWHTFILFTMDYTNFCQKYFGRYLHHQPSENLLNSECLGNCTCSGDLGSDEPTDRPTSIRVTNQLALASFAPLSANWSVSDLM